MVKINLNNFNSSQIHGSPGGNPFNDLPIIKNAVGSEVDAIWINKVMIRAGDAIDGFQFTYRIKKGDQFKEIEGTRCGGNGGKEYVVKLEKGEYLDSIEIQYGENSYYIGGLQLHTYNTKTGEQKIYKYGRTGDKKSQLLIKNNEYAACLFGRSGGCLDAIGIQQSFQDQQQLTFMEQDKIVELVNAQEWLNQNYPQAKRAKIKELDISSKGLKGELDLSDFVNLEELNCSNNRLTALNLSQQKELKKLKIRSNCFTNLEFIQPLTKLNYLDIWNIDATGGLEYLPLSLEEIECNGEIKKELSLYGDSLLIWQEAHPELMKKSGKELLANLHDNNSLKIVTTTPENLREELKKKQDSILNYNLSDSGYADFALCDNRPLAWETKLESLTSQQLPLRLYNLRNKKVEAIGNREDINHYLALSYVWGTDWEKESQTYGQHYETKLTRLGRKALNKVIKFWELIKEKQPQLHCIWIDNFCINQGNNQEQGEEVKKQKKYYNNATATLIAIDAKIGEIDKKDEFELAKQVMKQIVVSSWFQRSWTFQEGLLSKQTVFMFDDGLVDGRILARIWVGIQEEDYKVKLNRNRVYTTPLGWSYGAQREQAVNLGLIQALDAVKYRKKTVPVDGVYSILGLLPYGEKVPTNYHSTGYRYTTWDLKQALLEAMKVARANGYPYEPLFWNGERDKSPELWWVPAVSEEGSINIWGIQKIEAEPKNLEITAHGIKLVGEKDEQDDFYTRVTPNSELIRSDKKFSIYIPRYNYASFPIKIDENNNDDTNKKNSIFIDMVGQQVIEGEQAQIEIPPKK